MESIFRSLKSEWLPVGGYVDIHHAVRDIGEWIQGYYNTVRPIGTMVGYHPVNTKISGKRLRRYPNFVIHYKSA
jgi:transposase InsO family protein